MALFLKIGICSALLVMSVINVNGQCQGGNTHSTTAQSTSTSYIASDNYPSYYRNNIYCTTTISNPGSGRILFHVEHQDIERRYDFLYIYIGSVSSANRRHYSENQYSGSVGLTNPGEDLIVRFTSDSSITYGGYKVNFIAVENPGSCGTTITATSTEQQLTYVYSWHNSSPCVWTISAQNVGDSVQITVLFAKGIVQISEASAVTNLETSGSTYVSTQDTITVTGTYGNDFVVMYESTSSATAGTVTVAPVIRNEDSSICYERQKTAVFNTRFLYSPNYPSRYPNDVDCTVTLVADDIAKSITLTVNDYTVLVYDDLRIYDGDDTGFNEILLSTTESMTSSGASITLRFVTDYTSTARGFNISYSSVTRVAPTCPGISVTTSTSDATEQSIMSPNYPSSYDNNADLYWRITKESVSDRIVLDFRDFNVESNLGCTYDYVAIYDGPCTDSLLIAKICGNDPITYEEPTGLYILIHFHTDGSVVRNGWKLTYYIGTFRDPDADESTDDTSAGVPDFVYPVIVIAVIVIVAITITAIIYYQSRNSRVGVGEGKPETKRRTVSNLMSEITTHLTVPKNKHTGDRTLFISDGSVSKKTTITVIQRNPAPAPLPPPPKSLPPLLHDPVYPPINYQNSGSQMPVQNIIPVIPEGGSLQPSAPLPPVTSGSSMIPAPYVYMTPAEARKAGFYT